MLMRLNAGLPMSKRVLIDGRWEGDTGIGKLYREVIVRKPDSVSPMFIKSRAGLGNLLSPLMLANEVRRADADVFYSPSFMPPLYSGIPFVFTIHDLMHMFFYTTWHRLYYKYVLAKLATYAQRIITVSQFSKEQLISLLGIPEHLITVIYNGVDERFHKNKSTYFSDRPYFLYIGNRRKNKNLRRMLTAFSRAVIPDDFLLLISGDADVSLSGHLNDLGIAHRVRFLGHITERDLPELYRGAFGTLYVSLMEGFGLPVIESMASGTPVITSNVSALAEVAGDAALCVDPFDTEAISDGIERLVNDAELYEYYVQLGYTRSRRFSWETTAKKTWEAILMIS